MENIHPTLAELLSRHFGPRPRVSKELHALIVDLNRLFHGGSVSTSMSTATGESQGELEAALQLLESTLNSTTDGMVVVDPDGTMITHNDRFVELWNLPSEVVESRDFSNALPHILFELKKPDEFLKRVRELQQNTDAIGGDLLEFVDGRFFELHSQPQAIGGGMMGRAWAFRDVTEQRKAEQAIRHYAFHDDLTGLPNRALFHDRLSTALAQSKRNKKVLALLFVDLDRFKHINDTLGHGAGDALLKEVARRIQSRVRDGDTVARLAGDEFMVLVSSLRSGEDATLVADTIIDSLRPPIEVDGNDLHISCSIGISLYPHDGEDAESLMKNADIALYQAKDQGRNCYQVFQPGMNHTNMERLALENDLRGAIERDELLVYYQPQLNLTTRRIEGVEALVRWRRGEEILLPGRFIPLAEEAGLIGEIGDWVLKTAGLESHHWPGQVLKPVRISVNISAQQFWEPKLGNRIERLLAATGLPPSQLELELTESVIMKNPERTVETLQELRDMGVLIALDDFGTGHSSLSYLRRLPITSLKIDRSFVSQCDSNPTDGSIVAAVIALAQSLELRVVAEGVETREQMRFLRSHGCEVIQGFLFSPPVPGNVLGRILETGKPVTNAETAASAAAIQNEQPAPDTGLRGRGPGATSVSASQISLPTSFPGE